MESTYQSILENCQQLITSGNYHNAMEMAHVLLNHYEEHNLDEPIFNVFQDVEKLFVNTPDAILYITYMERLIQILKRKERFLELVNAMYYLAVDLIASRNYPLAKLYLQDAMSIAKLHHFHDSEADIYNGYGNYYEMKDENHKALKHYLQAYHIALDNNYIKGRRFTHNIGYAYKKLGDYTKALHYLKICVEYLETTDMHGRLANAYNELGHTYYLSGAYPLSEDALNKGRHMSQLSKSNSFLKENYLFTSQLYAIQKEYEKAYTYLKLHQALSDDLNVEKQNKEITQLYLKKELTSKEVENEMIKEKNMKLEAYSKALNESNNKLSETLNEIEKMHRKVIQSEKNATFNRMMVSIAHQLNTSLSNITLMSSQILNENDKVANKFKGADLTRKDLFNCVEQVKESASLIYNSTKKITHFIEKIKSSNTTLEDLQSIGSLDEMISELFHNYKDLALKKSCRLKKSIQDDLTNIRGYNVLKNLLHQLMDNALKYAFNNTLDNMIKINIYYNTMGKLVITFEDNGIGIDTEIIHKIFDPFYTTNMGYDGGDGLGLFILQRTIQDIFEGEIKCHSEKNQGTSFIIELGPHVLDI